MKRQIILHGYLKELYDKPIEIVADTVAEAMRSLQQIKELRSDQPHPVTIGGVDSHAALFSRSDMEEIHVYPRTGGSIDNPFVQIVLGVTLIGIGIFAPGMIPFLSQAQLLMAGALMVTGGVLQLLAPTPEFNENDQRESKYLGATGNTVGIGTRIPIGYGFRRVPGHYLSFDVEAFDYDGENADSIEDGKSLYGGSGYFEFDKTTPVDGIGVVDPRFSSPTAAATGNDPVAGWSP